MGESRIGIIHGDAHSLSGWAFAVETMEPIDVDILKSVSGCSSVHDIETNEQIFQPTTTTNVSDWLTEAGVDCFACTHTCLPFAQRFDLPDLKSGGGGGGGRLGSVINNGAAGLPNFSQRPGVGLMTRIATVEPGYVFHDKDIPHDSLYGATIGNLRIDAIAVEYDHEKWLQRFLKRWPESSPAHTSYHHRITQGTELRVEQAARRGFSLSSPHSP